MIESREYVILTQTICEHCSFHVYMPQLDFSRLALCPRCWRPLTGVEHDDEAELPCVEFSSFTAGRSKQATGSKSSTVTAQTTTPEVSKLENRFDSSRIPRSEYSSPSSAEPVFEIFNSVAQCSDADDCLTHSLTEDAEEPAESICLQTEEIEENLSYREKIRRWFASCGISVCVHAALLGLAALIVFQSYQFEWHSSIDSSFSESDALFAFDQMEVIEAPEFEFQPELTRVPDIDSVTELETMPLTSQSVAASHTAEGEGRVGFFGTRAAGKSFAFIVDISGSMTTPFPEPAPPDQEGQPPRLITRWERAREELLQAVDSMTAEQSFAVTLYNDTHYVFQPDARSKGLYPATKRNKQLLRNWLNSRFAGGGTDPRTAISHSLALKPEVVFLLTDGIIPYESRTVAQAANQNEAIIHTTCIGFLENEILQLIAQDHRGKFRAIVGGSPSSRSRQPGAAFPPPREITLVCVVSNSSTNLTKFRHVQKSYQRFREAMTRGDSPIAGNSETVLVLHNTASESPEFSHQLQRLLQKVNSGIKVELQKELHSGRLGMGMSLDRERPKDYRQALDAAYKRTSTIHDLLETVVPKRELQQASVSIPKVIVFGDRDARQEILSAVHVYNLYNGSTLRVIDGEETLRR